MAFEVVRQQKSINAGADLSAKQYTFVSYDSTGRVVTTGAGATSIGVLQDKPLLNDPASVCGPGDLTKVLCAGNIAAGQQITSDALGRAVAATSGSNILGRASFAGASGGVITMLFQPQGSKL